MNVFSYEKVRPCTCTTSATLLIKKQAGEFVKVIKILQMRGNTCQFTEKEMAFRLSEREHGEASIL